MKIAVVIGTSILGLVLGATAANAQHDRDEGRQGDSHRQKGNDHQQGNNSRQDHAQQPSQHNDNHQANRSESRHEQHAQEQQHSAQREDRRGDRREADRSDHWRDRGQRPEQRDVWYRHRAQHWEREHHTWRERGGYHGYRIPDDRFRAHFGRGHWFRIHGAPIMVVEGYPRFQYQGFWFNLVDPWPETWAPTWYQTDDVYVDYVNDGYYMYNRRHPGVAIAINVSF